MSNGILLSAGTEHKPLRRKKAGRLCPNGRQSRQRMSACAPIDSPGRLDMSTLWSISAIVSRGFRIAISSSTTPEVAITSSGIFGQAKNSPSSRTAMEWRRLTRSDRPFRPSTAKGAKHETGRLHRENFLERRGFLLDCRRRRASGMLGLGRNQKRSTSRNRSRYSRLAGISEEAWRSHPAASLVQRGGIEIGFLRDPSASGPLNPPPGHFTI